MDYDYKVNFYQIEEEPILWLLNQIIIINPIYYLQSKFIQ